MRFPRFLVDAPLGAEKEITITDSAVLSQWRHALRLAVGSRVVLADGAGAERLCLITELSFRSATLCVISRLP